MALTIDIKLICFEDYLSQYWNKQIDNEVARAIKNAALKAWVNRYPHEKEVRFIYKMPANNGIHFRFFTIKQNSEGRLIVTR
ncbi:hypothetical protein [Pasteurella oralis]|uniref:hypothetical protein n=1 Tax=Pasteurella oralis TaxID=1071947 RepID=UPI000C7D84D1|nr:hypothetical protein [Pasteurella oralis]